MYLVNMTQVQALFEGPSVASNSFCCGGKPTEALDTHLRNIRTRVENALNIENLARYTWRDTFEVERGQANRPITLRLTNAFIAEPESVKITTSNGQELYPGDELAERLPGDEVDGRYGLVHLQSVPAGLLRVEYISGFSADAEGVFINTPDWMQSCALAALRVWVLATSRVANADNFSLADVTNIANRELANRIYARYDRPRNCMLWPVRDVQAGAIPGPAPVNQRHLAW